MFVVLVVIMLVSVLAFSSMYSALGWCCCVRCTRSRCAVFGVGMFIDVLGAGVVWCVRRLACAGVRLFVVAVGTVGGVSMFVVLVMVWRVRRLTRSSVRACRCVVGGTATAAAFVLSWLF